MIFKVSVFFLVAALVSLSVEMGVMKIVAPVILVAGMCFLAEGACRWDGMYEIMVGGWVKLPNKGKVTKAMLAIGIICSILGFVFLIVSYQ